MTYINGLQPSQTQFMPQASYAGQATSHTQQSALRQGYLQQGYVQQGTLSSPYQAFGTIQHTAPQKSIYLAGPHTQALQVLERVVDKMIGAFVNIIQQLSQLLAGPSSAQPSTGAAVPMQSQTAPAPTPSITAAAPTASAEVEAQAAAKEKGSWLERLGDIAEVAATVGSMFSPIVRAGSAVVSGVKGLWDVGKSLFSKIF